MSCPRSICLVSLLTTTSASISKQEFLPADIGHHNHGRDILKTPGCRTFPIYLGVLRVLDKDRGRGHITQGGPNLAEEHLDLVKGAVDLGPDIVGIEAPPVLVDGRGARHLDQGSLGFRNQGAPGKGGPVAQGLRLAGAVQLADVRGEFSAGMTARRSRAPAAPVGVWPPIPVLAGSLRPRSPSGDRSPNSGTPRSGPG